MLIGSRPVGCGGRSGAGLGGRSTGSGAATGASADGAAGASATATAAAGAGAGPGSGAAGAGGVCATSSMGCSWGSTIRNLNSHLLAKPEIGVSTSIRPAKWHISQRYEYSMAPMAGQLTHTPSQGHLVHDANPACPFMVSLSNHKRTALRHAPDQRICDNCKTLCVIMTSTNVRISRRLGLGHT